MADKLATEQLKKHTALESKRKAIFDDDWQFISQYALPQQSDINQTKTEGVSGWTQNIFDTTLIQSMEILSSGLGNWWTPQNQNWAEYGSPIGGDQKEDTDDDVVRYLGRASDIAMRELRRSNFYMVKAIGDLGLAVFGTDCMICDTEDSSTELFNFTHCKIGTYTVEENYKGIVDTLRREIKMTYRQVCQKFGKPTDKIPAKMEEQAKGEKGGQKEFKILHCIFPREDSDRLKGAKNGPNKPFASVYISMEFKETIRESGYDENPILCRRFKKWGTDAPWGYGPAYLALPDARQVNYVEQNIDALAELHVAPRVLIPDNLDGDVDLRAGGVTTWDSSNPNAKPSEWIAQGEYKLGLEQQERKRQAIRDACYVDAFKLLNSRPLLDKDMTAFEISQRQGEQLSGLTVIDARTEPEFIKPLMQRIFAATLRAGKLGQAPEGLKQQMGGGRSAVVQPEIVVTSRFSQALRSLQNRGTEETIKFVVPIGEVKPEVWDVFDLDDTVREYARNAGMAPDNIRKTKGANSVADVRNQRAKLMQQQRVLQGAEQMSKAGKNLGGAPEWVNDRVKQVADNAN